MPPDFSGSASSETPPPPISPADLAAQMREAFKEGPEYGHKEADRLMCRVLEQLGYGEAVEIFRKVEKWYA